MNPGQHPPSCLSTELVDQAQRQLQRHQAAWQRKPVLRAAYAELYDRISRFIDPSLAGAVVEIGSGLGHLKTYLPQAICTDLVPHPGLDVVCDAYHMPFRAGTVSHLILLDVFHHLQMPEAFFREARRVLCRSGRLIVLEPFISLLSWPVYGLLHPEAVGWRTPINRQLDPPSPRAYYAAQGNATRLFFRREIPGWPSGWEIGHAEAFSSLTYLLSGGYSRPAFYPMRCLGLLRRLDNWLSRWPRLFGARCLVVLRPGRPDAGV